MLLYDALCGDVPFHADSYVETARLHAQAPIRACETSARMRRSNSPTRHARPRRTATTAFDSAAMRDELHELSLQLREHSSDTSGSIAPPRAAAHRASCRSPAPGPIGALPSIPAPPRRGLRIASIALLILVLAAGAALAAYLVHIRGSGTGTSVAQQTGGPTTQLVGTAPTTAQVVALAPVKLAAATSYDPEGDQAQASTWPRARSMRIPASGAPRRTRASRTTSPARAAWASCWTRARR